METGGWGALQMAVHPQDLAPFEEVEVSQSFDLPRNWKLAANILKYQKYLMHIHNGWVNITQAVRQ